MDTETVRNTAKIILTCIFVVFGLLFGMICFNTATSIKMELSKIKVTFCDSLIIEIVIYVTHLVHPFLSLQCYTHNNCVHSNYLHLFLKYQDNRNATTKMSTTFGTSPTTGVTQKVGNESIFLSLQCKTHNNCIHNNYLYLFHKYQDNRNATTKMPTTFGTSPTTEATPTVENESIATAQTVGNESIGTTQTIGSESIATTQTAESQFNCSTFARRCCGPPCIPPPPPRFCDCRLQKANSTVRHAAGHLASRRRRRLDFDTEL